ncbi:MAG: hypothetical protein QME51_02100 [Planctomycetota bacterium]|nr:hypothetical protein [Planctomycetota bacterium]MDI6787145.1 hypothetical protein [Planctomycetota bacterium]
MFPVSGYNEMVKFSDISKLWKKPDESDKRDDSDKKESKEQEPSDAPTPMLHRGGSPVRDGEKVSIPQQEETKPHLKIPEVSHARLIKTDVSDEKPIEEKSESIKYSSLREKTRKDFVTSEKSEPTDEPTGLSISSIKTQADKIEEDAHVLYHKLFEAKQNILYLADNSVPSNVNTDELIQLIRETIIFLRQNYSILISVANQKASLEHFISHQINTILYSISIGIGLGYNQSRLEEVGLVAFLHDIGMKELLSEKSSLTTLKTISESISRSINFLKQIPNIPYSIIEICEQYLNYVFHSSTPGIRVHEYVHIMRITDTFGALMYPSSDATPKSPQEVLRELISVADSDTAKKVLKVLIKQIGIYPIGTFILLNTNEIAEVIKNNEKFPLRPTVNIMSVSDNKLVASKTISLVEQQSIYIMNTLTKKDALLKSFQTTAQ